MEEYTDEELAALEEMGYGYPKEEEKQNIFSFFKRVISMPDTTRTANLIDDEIGLVKIPVRTNLNLSLYASEMGLEGLGEYFKKEAHIVSDSSLSREGFLDKLAVTQKREMDTKMRAPPTEKQKMNWFRKKQPVRDQY